MRWNGPLGSFTVFDARGIGVHNGDVVKATAVGGPITCYINNTAIFSVNDTAYHLAIRGWDSICKVV